MLVFDAEQLSFKKFDDGEVIWRTINGNHVPIPKHGSRAEKAKAIKEWFANKKKDLPKGKGRVSFYSARAEHEQPKRKARGSGENAQVHGDGQYTLKLAENNMENYFNKFGNSMSQTWTDDMPTDRLRSIRQMRNLSIADTRRRVDASIKRTKEAMKKTEAQIAEYKKYSNMSMSEMEEFLSDPDKVHAITGRGGFVDKNDAWRWFNRAVSEGTTKLRFNQNYIDELKEELKTYEDHVKQGHVKETYNTYMIGEKMYREEFSPKTRQKDVYFSRVREVYGKPKEERKQYVEGKIADADKHIRDLKKGIEELKPTEWGYHWDKRNMEESLKFYEKEKKWWENLDYENIVPAKAQMSKVRLPASKTYMREATSLRKQSPYVKDVVKKSLIDAYNIGRLRELGLPDMADEYESIIDDALGLNNAGSSASRIEHMLENMKSKLDTGFSSNLMHGVHMGENSPESFEKIAPPVLKKDEARKLNEAMHLVKHISDSLRVSLLAKDDNGLTINSGRGLYYKLGSIVANKKTRSFWGASTNNKYREATKILSKHGLSGIAYTGHGTSRVSGFKDGEGNVTFNPERDIEVLERTTDPEVIKQWITRQKKINNGGKNA